MKNRARGRFETVTAAIASVEGVRARCVLVELGRAQATDAVVAVLEPENLREVEPGQRLSRRPDWGNRLMV